MNTNLPTNDIIRTYNLNKMRIIMADSVTTLGRNSIRIHLYYVL